MNIERELSKYNLTPESYEKCLNDITDYENKISDFGYDDIKAKYNLPIHRDVLRKASQTIFGNNFVRQYFKEKELLEDSPNLMDDLIIQKHEIQKEKYKLFDERKALNKLAMQRARQEELNEVIITAIKENDLPKIEIINHEYESCDNDMLISLNDIHYGANINNYWNKYDSDICKQRFEKYLDEIIKIQQKNNCENCIVWGNGDFISGSIHKTLAITNKENVIQQVMGVSELIAQFLSKLSEYFKNVNFISVAGNHSRIDKKEDSLKDERLDDLIEWWISERLKNIENIQIGNCNKIDSTMYYINVKGLDYVGIHGDFDEGVNKVLSLEKMVGKNIYAILSGHLHHNKIETLQGIKCIMSGSFMGIDDYCVTKRIFGFPEQLVCICNDSGLVCSYDIRLKD